MKISVSVRIAGLAVSSLAALAAAQPTDSFHFMQIEQVIGGVNGDVTKQAIQLRMRSSFQNFTSSGRILVRDSAGNNPIIVIDMTTNVANFNGGDRVLVTSANFNSATTPTTVPDFTMTNVIPASYLAAGRLTWEDDFGTILWSLAWGGAAYTGSNTGSLTNSPTGNFGTPFPGPCPTTGVQAIDFRGTFSDAAGSNDTDYILTTGAAVWTNNARTAFALPNPPAPCYPNCDNSTVQPTLNANDFQCFLNAFAAGATYANCDSSTVEPTLNANDFQCFLNAFAAGCT